MSKYNAKKITIDGITFASKDEGKYYEYLKEQKAKGFIQNFELQPKYTLIPAFEKEGKKYRPITYTPDFLIYHNDNTQELIDVKSLGTATQQGELRRKMFNYFYRDSKLTWICRSVKWGVDGWIEYEKLKKIYRENKKNKKRSKNEQSVI